MNNLVNTFRALGQDARLRIYLLLTQTPLCVCQIEAAFDISQSAISQHLRVLREAGLVTSTRRGQWVIYEAQPSVVEEMCSRLTEITGGATGLMPDLETALERARQVQVDVCSFDEEGDPNPYREQC